MVNQSKTRQNKKPVAKVQQVCKGKCLKPECYELLQMLLNGHKVTTRCLPAVEGRTGVFVAVGFQRLFMQNDRCCSNCDAEWGLDVNRNTDTAPIRMQRVAGRAWAGHRCHTNQGSEGAATQEVPLSGILGKKKGWKWTMAITHFDLSMFRMFEDGSLCLLLPLSPLLYHSQFDQPFATDQ